MSRPHKLRGGSESELTRFKKLWPSLPAAQSEYWRALFVSDTKQTDIRELLRQKLDIKFHRNDQLTAIGKWLVEQDAIEDERTQQDRDQELLIERLGPDFDKDRLRDMVLGASYARTMSTGDFKLGLATTDRDIEVTKLAEAKKDQQTRALELCLEESKAFPAVQELFKAAFAALKKAKSAK